MWSVVLFGSVVLALIVDHLLGEPAERWHPVVWMGRYLDAAAMRFVPMYEDAPHANTVFWQGAAAWCGGALLFATAFAVIQNLALQLPALLAVLLLGLALKPLLAMAMLCNEVAAVEVALNESLALGRERLSRLVSRETRALSASQVREAAIETLAENLNDSVVSPIFWFLLGGLPAAALYRFANTADAMWGYPGMRAGRDWRWAGKWAAHADDVLSWPGARITAALVWLLTVGRFPWATLRSEAQQTPSPNSGWPMAAFALALNLRLEKEGIYVLHAAGQAPQAQHLLLALYLARKVLLACVLSAVAAIILIAFTLLAIEGRS